MTDKVEDRRTFVKHLALGLLAGGTAYGLFKQGSMLHALNDSLKRKEIADMLGYDDIIYVENGSHYLDAIDEKLAEYFLAAKANDPNLQTMRKKIKEEFTDKPVDAVLNIIDELTHSSSYYANGLKASIKENEFLGKKSFLKAGKTLADVDREREHQIEVTRSR